MKKHSMALQPRYYAFIKNGTKRIELRLLDEKRRQIQIGDIIEFSNGADEKLKTKVIGLLQYDTFSSLLNDFDISVLADKSMTKAEILAVLNAFYPPNTQKSLGVIGVRIEPIKREE